MPLVSLSDCCRRLACDAKTLHRWLAQAQLLPQPHPADARTSGITAEQLRLLACAHHRSLAPLPDEPAAPLPREGSALEASLLALPERLVALHAQLAVLQQQVAALTALLQPQVPPGGEALRSSQPTPSAPRPRPAAPPPRKPVHVIPRVEYASDGHYGVICPVQGVLPFELDSPAWFAWLELVSSFRFVGKLGHFTAHHEFLRVPHGAWRAHRNIRNHTRILRLATSQELTSAVLEQAAEALQAHVN